MVTNRYYEEEPTFRRYSGRGHGHGYPLSHDRELPSGPGHGPYSGHGNRRASSHDGRSSGQSPEQDSNTSNPRRRIPVACGRCRKRKIRCSGDPGNGGPCTNCKSAGNDSCQFLRVSSHEAVIKNEAAELAFETAPASSRLHCRMVPNGPQFYAPPPIALGPDGYPYRHQSLSAYQYPLKAYFAMPPFGEFADENTDYNLHGPSYPLMSPDTVGISSTYASSNAGRGWTPAPQLPKNNNTMFLEQDQNFNHGQYSTSSFPIRSMISSESKNMSLNGMASALPTAITDRVLPYPSAGRPSQGSFLRSNEGHSILQSSQSLRNLDGIHSYNNSQMSTSMMNAVKEPNNNSVSENASMSAPYLPLTSSNSDSISSSQLTCSSQYLGAGQEQTEIYTTQTNSNGLYSQPNDSSSSVSNGYSPSSRKPSQTSDQSSPATTLSNGHTYVPYISQSYPQPPMEEMPVPVTAYRSSDAGISAS